ncbi:MAG TPA: MarR family winged helix-turn-helix transcriptional regulator [Pseudonocardia sp.]|nr:MarR family winged helix-turn-helix transcriptional regulator [Pseudonocardia sp.]
MIPDEEMARAIRAVVIAAENFRLRAARDVLGVGSTEISALFYLFTEGTSTPTELAARLQITTASVTELVERLGRAGLARRAPHPHDRRKVVLSLTDAAQRQVGEMFERIAVSTARCTSLLDGDERETVLRFLHDLALAYSATSPTPQVGGAVLNP